MPKVYLLRSEDNPKLVKIGFTNRREDEAEFGAVHARLQGYREGISHSSIVSETLATETFETYFHELFKNYSKDITVRFSWVPLFKGLKPQEWFELPENMLDILVTSFSDDRHPTNVESVEINHLPIFLSGVLSAINWHAKRISPEEMAREIGLERFNKQQEELQRQLQQTTNATEYITEAPPEQAVKSDLTPQIIRALGNEKALGIQLDQLKNREAHRSVLAGFVAFLVGFLPMAIESKVFVFVALFLLAFWPNVEPFITRKIIDWRNSLKDSFSKSQDQV